MHTTMKSSHERDKPCLVPDLRVQFLTIKYVQHTFLYIFFIKLKEFLSGPSLHKGLFILNNGGALNFAH